MSNAASIEYRLLTTASEINQIPALESSVWGMSDVDCIPPSMTISLIHVGGFVVGAFDDNHLVGVCVSIPTATPRKLWSYMTATAPEYQNSGIGLKLKHLQRQLANERGFNTIAWTFDPLQTRNAYFNLCRLKAVGVRYHLDFYGSMLDSINAGMPSDRLEVEWNIRERNSRKNIRGLADEGAMTLLNIEKRTGEPLSGGMIAPKDSTLLLVHIPLDINAMRVSDPEKALRWRFALRGAMMEAFSAGFHVIGLEVGNEGYVYRFQKSGTWFMYVVQCSDGSLYTGTTTDVVRRFNQHNSGKGAKYTASRRPVTLLGTWMYIDRAAASQAELRFKRLRRTDKERIISNKSPFDGAEFD